MLNKVDTMVKELLLSYPTLYSNRFEALADIFTNSSYQWQDGNIVNVFPEAKEPTIESMLAKVKEELIRVQEQCRQHQYSELDKLHNEFITTAKQKLHKAEFIAANIDTFASTYCGVDYHTTWLWLFSTHHNQRVSQYWTINNKPDIVDEEWKEAIQGWFSHLLPSMNGLFGVNRPERWMPRQGFEKIFNWAYDTWKSYETEQDRKNYAAQSEMAKQIIDEILAEENSNKGS